MSGLVAVMNKSLTATYSNDEPVRVADQEQRDIVDKNGVEDQV